MTLDELAQLMSFDKPGSGCIEILFSIRDSRFDGCWMGKHWSHERQQHIYWFGIPGQEDDPTYYQTFAGFAAAPRFDGLSLQQVWSRVVIDMID